MPSRRRLKVVADPPGGRAGSGTQPAAANQKAPPLLTSSDYEPPTFKLPQPLRHSVVLILTTISVVVALNLNTLGHGFVYDDARGVVTNGDVTGTNSLSDLFVNDFWGKPMSRFQSHKSYRPLTVITFRANHILAGGLDAKAFHATNIMCHALVSVLFLWVCQRVFGVVTPAVIATSLFVVHPIHCEAVANVVGRAELLGAAWFLVALLAYIRGAQRTSTGWLYMAMAFIATTAAMLSKEQGITALLVMAAYDAVIACRLYPVQALAAMVSFNKDTATSCSEFTAAGINLRKRFAFIGIVSAALLALRLWMMAGSQPIFNENELPAIDTPEVGTRWLTYGYYAAVNFALLCYPVPLCSDWSYRTIPLVTSLFEFRGIVVGFTFIMIAVVGIWLLRSPAKSRFRELAPILSSTHPLPKPLPEYFGMALLLLTYLPSSNLLFPVGFVIAERVLYLPSMGWCILVAAILVRLGYCWPRTSRTLFVIILAAMSYKTISRNAEWASDFDLHEAGVKTNPNNVKLQTNYGMLLHERGKDIAKFNEVERAEYLQRAEAVYQYTLENVIGEDRFPNLFFSYGNLLQEKGKIEDAILLYRHGLKKRDRTRTTISILNNLGSLLYKKGEYAEAEQHFLSCIQIDSAHLSAHNGLAALYAATNRSELAEEKFKTVVEMSGGSAESFFNYGTLLAQLPGRLLDAEKILLNALEKNPGHTGAASNLKYVRYTLAKGKQKSKTTRT